MPVLLTVSPAPDEVLTIRPQPRSFIAGTTARVHRNMVVRFASTTLRQASTGTSSSGRPTCPTTPPAVLTRMSTGPTAVKTSLTADGSVRSAAVSADPSRAVGCLSTRCTLAPSAARASAIAAPIPWAPPVTTATLPASDMLKHSVSHFSCDSARYQVVRVFKWFAFSGAGLGGAGAPRPAGAQGHRLADQDIGSAGAVDPGDQRVDGRRAELGQGHANAGDRHVQGGEGLIVVQADQGDRSGHGNARVPQGGQHPEHLLDAADSDGRRQRPGRQQAPDRGEAARLSRVRMPDDGSKAEGGAVPPGGGGTAVHGVHLTPAVDEQHAAVAEAGY